MAASEMLFVSWDKMIPEMEFTIFNFQLQEIQGSLACNKMAPAVRRADTSIIYSSIQLQRRPKIKMPISNINERCIE